MRKTTNLTLCVFLASTLVGTASAQKPAAVDQNSADAAQQAEHHTSPSASAATVDHEIDAIIKREHEEIATIRRYSPIIETYIQDTTADKKKGVVPVHDHYFLGQAELSKGIVDDPMVNRKRKEHDAINPISHLSGMFTTSYVPEGFLQMVFIDRSGFDRQHYKFRYVGEEPLGDVRCLIFNVEPLPKSGNGRFRGRIWVEDQDYSIVRFTGVYFPIVGANGFNLHFDSWRWNVQPGLWLPAYVFSRESDLNVPRGHHVRFRSQTRLWGYSLKDAGRLEEFSELTIESPDAVQDQTVRDRSPIEAQRAWRQQAEKNVLEGLQRTGLLAPQGETDKALEKVVNNLVEANDLSFDPELHCRVMLTDTLEMFAVGHTIVLSRGLLDVLPDEPSLATMLAQELADIMVTQATLDQWGFNDATRVTVAEAMIRFSFKDTPEQIRLASQKALELLKNSPYKDKLASAGLFLKQLDLDSKALPALVNPHLGNRVYLAAQLMALAPKPDATNLEQIPALPIGSRVHLDPWNDQVEWMSGEHGPLLWVGEQVPFEITPYMPHLTRYGSTNAPKPAANSDTSN